MPDFIMAWLLLAGIPLGLALLCGFIQKLLAAHLDGELKVLRPLLLGILPLACGLSSLYMLFKVLTITGWDMLGWGLHLFWTGSALLGTLFGWGMGNDKRKKRQNGAALPQKE